MGDPSFVRRFGQASRPGAYLRILEEGHLGAGDAVEVDPATLPAVSACGWSPTRSCSTTTSSG
ncbi:MAG: MOSC domain-containing protein, partial [Actinomycetota bacterium]|nr:MOSC domain-containing protein [Actinomycetota bacterium]